MRKRTASWRLTLLCMVLGGAVLAGCGRDANRSAGQEPDDAGAAAAGKPADGAASRTSDAAITAEVKASIARDDRLSALAISVDTTDGHVLLRGAAPDTAARKHAAETAQAVHGVGAVNNELSVQPRSN